MATRIFWKGYLKLSLVTCPVTMVPATTEFEAVRFHTLNRKTGNRIASHYIDAESGKPVSEDDQAKAYASGENKYVLLEEEELDSVALDSARTIDIELFAAADSIEWTWYDKPHYLMPGDPVAEEAFAVIRSAMESTGTVGISRLVLYRRERAVLLKPRDKGIVLWTLRYGDELRPANIYFGHIKRQRMESKALALACSLIEERKADWSPQMTQDPVRENLRSIIAAKRKGKKPIRHDEPAVPETGGNVIHILDALRKSIASEKSRRK